MFEILDWLFARPNTKWKSATKIVTGAWLLATAYPTFHLYDVMSDATMRLQSKYAWMLLAAWSVVTIVVLGCFTNLANLSSRVDQLESELSRLRSDRQGEG